jgi:hypothetical protein
MPRPAASGRGASAAGLVMSRKTCQRKKGSAPAARARPLFFRLLPASLPAD